ncbi:MAG: signal transduction protein, partial [Cyanobacteria bacterium J06623_5]
MGRSLRASKEGQAKAKHAFKLKGWTQEYLAGTAGCYRGVVINFFARRPVAKGLFQAFCVELGLEWGEVAELEADEAPERSLNIDEQIVSVRNNIYGSVIEKCGFMRVLDMSQPIGLDDIYTDVNILEKITGRRRLGISQLLEQVDIENFERFSLSGIREERVSGLQAVMQHSKLMILGKPGAGKTTFLKHLAIQCVEGRFKPKLV